ncbi:autotransporter outer membrane beta-barrel domain-containing protein [Hyphomicrobium sp. NDB2Meth4]|uniref:autotransporter outer membrane beta-barrel domain-containing protein n=1 Tax=Hyphomicrobium sp. NDB2Meth4 TaxID=1892846 RepID=UPI000930A709|nr:autotransporter outer membrane beta-barrel domain-containing protein [Hyphomicrobium sp. NDB2Meth4]
MAASRRYLRGTICATALFLILPAVSATMLVAATPALAEGGAGGANGGWDAGDGGAGGSSGSAGSSGETTPGQMGGGGAGGAGGSAGVGSGGDGGNGGDGVGGRAYGGGGGGGGGGSAGDVYSDSTLYTNQGALTGGAGGSGGAGGIGAPEYPPAHGGGGGGGGEGGIGLLVGGDAIDVSNTGEITGGKGGDGGRGGSGEAGWYTGVVNGDGGDGGDGNSGLVSNTAGITLTNTGTIAGGDGGRGGQGGASTDSAPGANGSAGAGGVGISGLAAGLTIINAGTISGGLAGSDPGNGSTRANAIVFSGDGNTLEIRDGSVISGNVVAAGTDDVFRLGGEGNGLSFDLSAITVQYQGFEAFAKSGGSAWTLTGSAETSNWTVTETGTLINNGTIGNVDNSATSVFINDNGAKAGAVDNAGTGSNAGEIASLNNTGGSFNNSGTVTNASTVSGGTVTNTGEFQSTVANSGGTFNNDADGTTGAFTNSAETNNNGGTIASLDNSGDGVFTQTSGTVSNGVSNDGTVNASGGAINGDIDNNGSGLFNVGGNLASNGVFTNAAEAELNVTGGDYTGLLKLDNSGTVDIGDGFTLSAGTINNNAGQINIGINSTLEGTGNTLNNATTINVATDGNIADAGAVNNLATGIINFNGPGGTATVTSDINEVTNLGQFNVFSGNVFVEGSAPGTATFTNGATGSIDMVSGSPNQTFTVDGIYKGVAGSTISVDFNAKDSTADQLRTVDATGVTVVNFNRVASGVTAGTLIVSQSSDINTTETFAAGTGLDATGFFTYEFVKEGQDWVVRSGVDQRGAASIVTNVSGALSTMASGFFEPASNFVTYKSGDANRISCSVWTRADAGRYDVGSESAINFAGGGSLGNIETEQRLTYQGGQVGADCGTLNVAGSGWNAHVGATGGMIEGDLDQLGSVGSTDIEMPFAGAYAFLTNGTFVFDASYRHDFNSFTFTNMLAGLDRTEVDGTGDNVSASALFRADLGGGVYVSPSASISYTRYDSEAYRFDSGGILGTVESGSDESLLGKLGVQIAFVQRISVSEFLTPYASASAWRNFLNETDLALMVDSTGGGATTITSDTRGPASFGQYTGGVSYSNLALGIAGYLQGTWREGGEISGGSITGGGRVDF